MVKFDLNYKLSAKTNDGDQITIERPFTLEFNIKRSFLSSANACTLRIYNLNPKTRSRLFKDTQDFSVIRKLELLAGYGNDLALVFSGDIYECTSTREGVNNITEINCYDGGAAYANGTISRQYPQGTALRNILSDLTASLNQYGVQLGYVGGVASESGRGNSYSGNPVRIIQELTKGGAFIDNGIMNILAEREVFADDILLITAETGLLNTPRRNNLNVEIETLFEPQAKVGQIAQVSSLTAQKELNQPYKIVGIDHSGIISESTRSKGVTKLELLFGELIRVQR